MQLLGIDAGTSSIKVAILDGHTGQLLASSLSPPDEMRVQTPQPGWAEQHPEDWWKNLQQAIKQALQAPGVRPDAIKAIGIAYQMHGLVLVDESHEVLRPAIIWSDSRAVSYGESAFQEIGEAKSLRHLLNSPGNFTAAKLAWVLDQEPQLAARIHKFMLPGDYLAMRLSGDIRTSYAGLSEGIMWDFQDNTPAHFLLQQMGINSDWLPQTQGCFAESGRLRKEAAASLGLPPGIPITYRAGDQPNNAFALGAVSKGEVAATAGTSGVVYAVTDQLTHDSLSRVNSFAHVNHHPDQVSLGILLCINGTGILNNWLKRTLGQLSYQDMNEAGLHSPIGAEGLRVLPFGNGAERVLQNQVPGAQISGLDLNRHERGHLIRAAHEGIAFSFRYGLDIMRELGVDTSQIKAGEGNMFLSPIFREALATTANLEISLYATDGAQGAARGAGVGLGLYRSAQDAHQGIQQLATINPIEENKDAYEAAYQDWLAELERRLS